VPAQSPLATLAPVDTMAFLPIALAFGIVALLLRRRPFTRPRLMEVALETSLLVMMAARYAVLAVALAAAPALVLGPDAPSILPGVAAGVCLLATAMGLAAVRGGAAWRMAAGVVFLLVTLTEALGNALVLDVSLVQRFDTGLSVLIAGGTVVLAAFYWTRRTASPNPLGSDGRPFDY